jgi:hypothetical protein
MSKEAQAVTQSSNFNLKNEFVELVDARSTSQHAFVSLQDLESMRTQRPDIPASKHGLETICGASCETGAQ